MKVWIVSTELKNGKGGISTALVGFWEALNSLGVNVEIVTSHNQEHKWLCWFMAFFKSFCIKKDESLWLHSGNWFSLFRKITLSIIPSLRGANIIFHYHDDMDEAIKGTVYRNLVRISTLIADKVIFLTPYGVDILRREGIHVAQDKVCILANPIDSTMESNLDFKRELTTADTNENKLYNLLCMTRLECGKGVDLAVKAISYLPSNYRLIVAGDGSIYENISQLIDDLGLEDRVSMLGWVEYKEKFKLLKESDIFILPTEFDSFGMCFIEAMSAGMPVVALDRKATPYVVHNGVTGLLAKAPCAEELAGLIERIVIDYDSYSINARAHVQEHFMAIQLAEQFVKECAVRDERV